MDEAAFAEMAERYRHELRVHCYRMLGSFTDAEDLVQETLLRAWRKRESCEGRSTFRAWLYRIATNACLDALAGPVRQREMSAAPAMMAEVSWLEPFPDRLLDLAADGPDAAVVARETIELAFLAAIQHLPVRQRAVIIMRDVLGWPAAETAEVLETNVAAVKGMLQRGRMTLRAYLPRERAEWSAQAGPDEREVLRRYVEANERSDLARLKELLREDARQTMPPHGLVYEGREAILELWGPVLAGDAAWGEWRSLPLWANRQPAVANYVRRVGEERFTPVNLDVLAVRDGRIAEITTFDPRLLESFGLPAAL
ncbi:RNA polymerase subunit sigma-70 [Actinomadura rugatobispora]|uniref:RNA polymerase sigma factor n=1 Tax=Actinomadura rugatobispora TaxID=1994 RepID=A0ABW0ZS41_9ACTN|nr:RNA polymerase subunit sigma-70 [Actinomadura rugatobispora]